MKPDLIILGVGHSGTSVLARMLFGLGWEANDADQPYAESRQFRRLNERVLFGADPDAWREAAGRFLRELRRPWALKDPRFVVTWRYWLSVPDVSSAALLWITKDLAAVRKSYERRGERLPDGRIGLYGRTLEELFAAAEACFAAWPGPKLRIGYEQLAAAVSCFDSRRAQS